MAGPWFSVHDDSDAWQTLDTLWFTDGDRRETVRVELRASLDPAPPTPESDR